MNSSTTLKQIVDAVLKDIDEQGLEALSPVPVGNYAHFRALELAAAMNRLRTLSAAQKG